MDISPTFSNITKTVFFKSLGLEDKNNNGYIEQGEGLEEFTAEYGDADQGRVNIFGNNTEINDGKLS